MNFMEELEIVVWEEIDEDLVCVGWIGNLRESFLGECKVRFCIIRIEVNYCYSNCGIVRVRVKFFIVVWCFCISDGICDIVISVIFEEVRIGCCDEGVEWE